MGGEDKSPLGQCSSPCASVATFVGRTDAMMDGFSRDFGELKLGIRECFNDMRRSSEVIGKAKEHVEGLMKETEQQNERLREGDAQFERHERRLANVEKTLSDIPDSIQAAVKSGFESHVIYHHKPINFKLRVIMWGIGIGILFLFLTDHGVAFLAMLQGILTKGPPR